MEMAEAAERRRQSILRDGNRMDAEGSKGTFHQAEGSYPAV